MTIPKAVTDMTNACEAFVAALRTKQAEYKVGHRRGKFWRGSSEDPADHSRVTKIVAVPDGLDPETGEVRMKRERVPGLTMGQILGGIKLPASVAVDVSEYQSPDGPGWFVRFLVKPGGGYVCQIDGEGPERHGFAWRPTSTEV